MIDHFLSPPLLGEAPGAEARLSVIFEIVTALVVVALDVSGERFGKSVR
jgi:hypothetical protein